MKLAPFIFLMYLGVVGFLVGYKLFTPPTDELNVAAALPQSVAVFETSLASPITSSATSLTLTANSVRGGGTLSGFNCFTIDEGSAQAEYVCGTVSSTAVTSLTRGVSPSTGTSTVASLQYAHRRGANVKITDFPVIQILKAQLNAEDTIPHLLLYDNTNVIQVGAPTTTLATKYYVDNVSVAGAATADETTKGIAEAATKLEMASSTRLGSTGASLFLQSQYATTTPASRNNWVVVSRSNSTIDPLFIATSSEPYNWGALHTFSAGFIDNASSTFTQTAQFFAPDWHYATSSLFAFNASSTATSTMQGSLTIAKAASTTDLIISRSCVGCINGYERVSGTGALPTSASTDGSAAATCSTGKKVLSCGSNYSSGDTQFVKFLYPDTNTSCSVTYRCPGGGSCVAGTITAYAVCVYP